MKLWAAKHIHMEDTVHFTGSTHRAFVTNKSHNGQLNSDTSFLITTPRYNRHSLNGLCVLHRVVYLSLHMNLLTFGQIWARSITLAISKLLSTKERNLRGLWMATFKHPHPYPILNDKSVSFRILSSNMKIRGWESGDRNNKYGIWIRV